MIAVHGVGFGESPVAMPFTGNLDDFSITVVNRPPGCDHDRTYGWEAGHGGNLVTVDFASWGDNLITTSGFAGLYGGGYQTVGVGEFTANPGDTVIITVWNIASGQGTAWAGVVPGGSVPATAIASVAFGGIRAGY